MLKQEREELENAPADQEKNEQLRYEKIAKIKANEMQLAEKLCGKEAVVKAIEDIVGEVRFDKCILESDTMLQVRRTVNQMVFDKMHNA